MSIRAFAAHLGVSERMVSKWEAGDALYPRPINQAALDTSLACSNADVHERFTLILSASTSVNSATTMPDKRDASGAAHNEQVKHPVDGKLMAPIEGGTFLCGSDNRVVSVEPYYIDVFPTTNADYARFVAATRHPAPSHWGGRGNPPDGLLDHPVVFVTWRDAAAYAAWAAKSLPTSEQWEKAARGTGGDVYPWGNQPTPAKCNVREGGIGGTTPVNRYHSGVSPFGVYDMCGNVWEWCSTETAPARCALKASAFTSPFFRAAPSNFNDASIDMMDDDTGFRCASPATTIQSLLARRGHA